MLNLPPIFKTVLRQAEQSDARLEIRRDEKQGGGKKQAFEQDDDSGSGLWEDSSTVSVEALRTFLIEFLKARGDDVPEAGTPPEASDSLMTHLPPEERAPATPVAARAVKAYAAMAAQSPGYQPPTAPPPPQTETGDVDLVSLLHADEIRTMHQLITELDRLAARGVHTLTILKADTFLEAIVQAVRFEKSAG